jgi:ribose transport system ATP-binding protein
VNESLDEARHPLLRIAGLCKSFGGVRALVDVDMELRRGEIHGLIGSNGAGKSTLIKILSGDIEKDEGEIYLEGQRLSIHGTQDAFRHGFGFIHQELNLIPKFSIIENLMLGFKKPMRFGLIDWGAAKREAQSTIERIAIKSPLDRPVDQLSVAERWLVSIARALMRKVKFISMDEPTASLSAEEAERLFGVIRELSASGVSVLYVSHRLDEIIELCDGISVFKDGRCVLTTDGENATRESLVVAIVGGKVEETHLEFKSGIDARPVVLEARKLSKGQKVKDVSFALHKGEVLGLGGLVGAGRTELAELLFGIERPDDGQIIIEGKAYAPKSPGEAIRRGIGYVPEERRSQGLILKESVLFNITLPNLRLIRISRFLFFLSRKLGSEMTLAAIKRLLIKAPSPKTPVIDLSGGNQQKVVIGKWLSRNLKVFILDEPSHGVDVGARAEIHARIRELAADGAGVIMISSDNEELPYVCDRVMVMAEGRVVGFLEGEAITKEAILHKSFEKASP